MREASKACPLNPKLHCLFLLDFVFRLAFGWWLGGGGGGKGRGGWGIRTSFILHKDVEQENLSQASMPFATMPKTLASTAVYAQNTGIYSVFASLYNILHKDVEQENLSQASMLFATMPKTLVFTAFYAPTTRIYSAVACLYNILHKDVEQENPES